MKFKLSKSITKKIKVCIALTLVISLLVQFASNGYVFASNENDTIAVYNVGVNNDNVIATLTKDGTMTLSGSGETSDYTADTMPFADNIDKITNIIIEDGVTSIGDYLFFGCKNLNDKLEFPSTITSIGDYAFSGVSKDTAPSFTYITNEFKTADISVPVKAQTEETKPEETTDPQTTDSPNDATDQNPVEEKTDTTDGSTDVSSSQDTGADTATVEDTQTPQSNGTEKTMEIKTITEQEIGIGIFFEGQSGGYKAETTNESFRTAVESAGYIEADRFVEVKLDGVITQHLAVKDGKMIIPSLPSFGIVPPNANNAYKTSTFVGWIIDGTTYQPKETCEISDSKDTIELTSSWKTEWAIDPQVKTEAKEEISVYSIIDENTGSTLEEIEGYSINVQWQINTSDKDDENAWENIENATSFIYKRKIESNDISSYFRANIIIQKNTTIRSITEVKEFITNPVNGQIKKVTNTSGSVKVIYHYNDSSSTSVNNSLAGQWDSVSKTYTTTATIQKDVGNSDFYGDLLNYTNMYEYKISLIQNPFTDHPIAANGVSDVNDVASWVYGNESNPYTNWNYPIGTSGKSDGYTNPDRELSNPNYYMQDGDYILSEKEKQDLENGKDIEINFYAYWGKVVYASQDGNGSNDGSSVENAVKIGGTSFDDACSKFSGGDMFSNVILLISDTRFQVAQDAGDAFLIGNNNSITISSIKNNDGSRNKIIIGNRGLKLTNDLRFVDIAMKSDTHKWPLLDASKYYLFIDDGIESILEKNGIHNLKNFDTSSETANLGYDPADFWMGIFGSEKGLRIESGIFRRISGNLTDGNNSFVEIEGSSVTNPVVLTDEAIGGLYSTNRTNITINGYVIGAGAYSGTAFKEQSIGNTSLTIKSNAKVVFAEYINGKQTVMKGVYGGGRLGKVTTSAIINIESGAYILGNVYAGSRDNTAGNNGTTVMNIGKAVIIGSVYGGGNDANSDDITLNLDGTKIYKTSENSSIIGKGELFAGGFSKTINKSAVVSIKNSEIGTVYAGNDNATMSIIPSITIANSNIQMFYGGGNKGEMSNTGKYIYNFDSGIYGSIYGSGNSAGNKGVIEINIKQGVSVNNIYGGSNTSGTTSESIVNINGEVNANVYAGGKGAGTTVKTSNLNINAGANILGNAFGGSEEGVVTASNVTLNGGYVANVFGGSDKANITGSTKITSSTDSEAGNIYAGCNASGFVTNPTMNLAGKADNVFAGGNATDKTIADISGTSTINVTSNQDNIITNVYGGANNTGLVSNSVINIQGYAENVFGGGLGAETVTNTPTVNVKTNGNITGNLYGGGEEGSTHGTTVNIEAGTVKNAFAGGHKAGVDGAIKISSSTGSTVTNMYGGSNESGIVNSPTVTVAGNVENVYGGGLGVGTTTTSPIVNIETNANVTGNVFGGGDLGNVSNPTVNLNGGTVNNAFAGGNAVGVTGTVALNTKAGSTATNIYGGSNSSGTVESPVLSIVGNATNIYGGGLGAKTTTKNPSIAVTNGSITNIYGGGEEGLTSGTNKLIIEGGTVTNVFGAGKSVGASDTDIAIDNQANVTNAYGGSESSGDTTKSNLKIDGTVTNVYGGGLGANTTVKTTYVKTTTAANVTDIYGGSKDGSVTDATLVIQGSVQGSIYGGGFGKTSVIEGDTWVYVANNVKGNIYGGGNEGSVNGNTHVDIANGIIGTSNDENTGNVFGGSNQAKVQGNTKVHIGSYVVDKPIGAEIPTTKSIDIKGTVFGGGNTTATGKAFDASDPYVIGTATVEIGGNGQDSLTIEKSIFGDGNKCVVNGDKIVTVTNYVGKNTSIQRATKLTLEKSELELVGETDSANLVTTSVYSLNRIDNLILKGGTTLKLQNGVNLVMGFESQNADGKHQTRDESKSDATGNKLYIQQGQHVEFRINEDVSRPGYGDIKGFSQLGRYYVDANNKPIDVNAQGVYVMGSYYNNADDNTNSGFIVADDENFGSETEKLTKGETITPTTNSSSWRNWLLGSSIKNETVNMIVSDQPGNGKIEPIKGWAADGSIYRVDPSTLTISDNSSYTIVDPDKITSSSDENTIGLSIETGQTGWLEQVKAGYIDSATKKIIPYKTNETLSTDNSLDMRSIINTSQQPVINIKLYNSDNITNSNAQPITITFSIDKITQQPDGSEVKTGTIKVTVNITKEKTDTYQDILISQGKVYDRADQTYNINTANDVATSVSKGSSITAQFAEKVTTPTKVTNYGLLFTSAKTVNKVNLPVGTKILMIDRSGSMPVYYNYTVSISGKNSIDLTEFVKNGTNDKFAVPNIPISKSNFLFVVDFADASTFENADICMTLKSSYEGGTSSDKKVRFAVTGTQRQYEMSSNQDNSANETTAIPSYRMNGTFGMTLNTKVVSGGEGGTDTTGSDKQMAAKVQLKLMNSTTGAVLPIPNGWQILSNGTRYSTSGDSATIVLANSLTATNSDIYVIMSNMGDIPAGNYELEISLVAGAMANYPSETLNKKTVKYKFKLTDDRYSIKATIRDENKLVISKTDDNKTMEYDILRVSNGSLNTSDVTTKVTLWKKQSGGYEQVAINENINSITGVTIDAKKNYGTLPWSTYKTVKVILNKDIEVGSYQLRYDITQMVTKNDNTDEVTIASEVSPFIITND